MERAITCLPIIPMQAIEAVDISQGFAVFDGRRCCGVGSGLSVGYWIRHEQRCSLGSLPYHLSIHGASFLHMNIDAGMYGERYVKRHVV